MNRAVAAFVYVALLSVALGVPSARAFLPAPYGRSVVAVLPDSPATLDPARASRQSELQLALLLYDPLYRLHRGRPRPHLVHPNPDVSANGLTWRLRLRQGILLHNGQTLTAQHVVTSLNRVIKGPNGYLLAPVRSVTATADGEHLVFQLYQRRARLPWLLAAPCTAVAVKHRGSLIGSGPFVLRSKRSSGLRLAAYRLHFAGRPFIDTLWFKVFPKASAERLAFQVGKLHLSLHGTSTFTSQPQQTFTEVHSPIMTATVFLGVGRSRAYLTDPQFRLALLKGIDRKRLGRVAVTGTSRVAAGPSPLLRRGLKVVGFDRKGANRLLAALANRHRQLRQDAGSGRLKLTLLVDASRFEDHDVASQVVADLDLIGISTSIEARPAKEYARRLASGQYQLVIVRYPVQVPIGKVSLASVLGAAGQRAAAKRCLAARRCGRAEARTFMKRLPLIPLVHTSTRVAFDARIGGARITRIGLIPYADLFWTRGAP